MSLPMFMRADDGCRLAYEYFPSGGKPTLVLSPSLGTAMALFDAQIDALSERYNLLRYDPRGHGASDAPGGGYSLDRLGRDVLCLLDHLKIESAHFVGVSLGGMTGQWLGYRAPERLLSLTLANTSAYMGPPSGWAERIAAVLETGMQPMVKPVLERWFTASFQREDPTEVTRIADMLAATDPLGYAGCCGAIRDMDLRPILPLIAIPTLVIAGRHDPATPAEHARLLADQISGASLIELDAAHLSNVEKPCDFGAATSQFLEQL